jgi:hypothetical protein
MLSFLLWRGSKKLGTVSCLRLFFGEKGLVQLKVKRPMKPTKNEAAYQYSFIFSSDRGNGSRMGWVYSIGGFYLQDATIY